jgi:hypothetical protein
MSLLALRHFDLTVEIDERTAETLLTTPAASMEYEWIGPQAAGAFVSRTAFADWAVTRSLLMAPGRTCYSPAEAVSWIEESGSSFLKCNHTTGRAGARLIERSSNVIPSWKAASGPSTFLMQGG